MNHLSTAPHATLPLLRVGAVLFLLGSMGALLSPAYAQAEEDAEDAPRKNPYGTGAGLEVLLSNNGFGLGGYYRRGISKAVSLLIETSLGPGKDDRELKFYSFGSGFIPNKRNYFLMLPIHLGVEHRLFSESIEDNFRPYLYLSGGPTFGWQYPYFDDENGNERYDEDLDRRYDIFSAFPRGELRLGMGGMVAVGAYFGLSRRVTQGVRFGYALNYFFDGVQLLEPDIKAPQQVFHSPIISITFGKLF